VILVSGAAPLVHQYLYDFIATVEQEVVLGPALITRAYIIERTSYIKELHAQER
jgi:hypothetical protein